MSVRISVLSALLASGLVTVGIAAPAAGATEFAPVTSGIQRYAAIWKRSPFIVETVAVQVSVGLSAKYSLVGIVSMAGQPAVFLVDKNNGDVTKNRLMVLKGQPSSEGIELVSVALESDPRKSSAVIRQGGLQATLSFDSTAMGPTGPSLQPGAVPPPPSAMVPPPGMPRMMPSAVNATPANATPPPSPRRIIRPAPINLSN